MRTGVRVGGEWLGAHFEVSAVKHSTTFRRDAWSGDFQASCSFAAPADFEAPWFGEGLAFDVVKAGSVVWSGVLAEKTPGEVWELHAFGWGSLAENFNALVSDGAGGYVPTSNPSQAISSAIARGWNVRSASAFSSVAIATGDGGTVTDMATLLGRDAQAQGKRWGVDSTRGLLLLDEPTTPAWVLSPGDAYLGTVDTEFVTHLRGLYVSAVDASGKPSAWGVVTASDTFAASKFGATRERFVDLTPLGLMSSGAAQANINGRFSLVGARTGWTNAVPLTGLNVRHISGAWADPTMVKAGSMLRIPGVMDSRSNPTTRGSVDIVLAEVEHDEDSQTSVATPVGFAPRDLASVLADAQAPDRSVEAA